MTGYLLDTHSFLWSVFTPERLSRAAQALLANAENPVYVSSVSFWEISLKAGIGKLTLTGCVPDALPEIAQDMGYRLLPLAPDEAASFHRLPRIAHKDPFDRMLIWQAIQRRLVLMTKDAAFDEYRAFQLQTFW
ncbi:type II toxin-antitoxin system VapC family toxin [uncultured Thiodictyon sp.]|uniref:type II toxin-antitoxin system VapC family toxin n=1 Tax=uncultured Thiodictyon sp. TaxID=1846217 RepID=UPI0025F07EC5|nr:type II toxin-antitoxin system VapC family toxin [uncultured Thiodictyon sp.]